MADISLRKDGKEEFLSIHKRKKGRTTYVQKKEKGTKDMVVRKITEKQVIKEEGQRKREKNAELFHGREKRGREKKGEPQETRPTVSHTRKGSK